MRTPVLTLLSALTQFGFLSFNSASADTVDSLTLINADTDLPIAGYDPFLDGATLNLATLPTQNLNVVANTTPADNGSVSFALNGNSNFQTENSPPYALAGDSGGDFFGWTPSVGANTLTVTAYDANNAGGNASPPLTINFTVVNQPDNENPVVSISSPAEGAMLEVPATIVIAANASDPDGTISKVEFFEGSNSLGVDANTPFALTWSDVPIGVYALTAVAADNDDNSTTSSPVSITVGNPAEQVKDTKFNPKRGFFDTAFDLVITTNTEGATILYTTDGSEPTETNGTPYTGPIPVATTTIIRAFAFKPGAIATNVDTHSYVFVADVGDVLDGVDGTVELRKVTLSLAQGSVFVRLKVTRIEP